MSSQRDASEVAAQSEEERDRKAEHIDLALEDRMQVPLHPFDRYYFTHNALPGIDRPRSTSACGFCITTCGPPC